MTRAPPCRLPRLLARARGVCPPSPPFSSSSASPVLAVCINTPIQAVSLRKPAAAFFVVSAAPRYASGHGRYNAALRFVLGVPAAPSTASSCDKPGNASPHRRRLPRRALLHALAARDGGRLPQRRRPARPRRLHRPLRSFNTQSGRCARTAHVVQHGDAASRPSSQPMPGAINPARRPREQPRQRAVCCAPTLPPRLTMRSAATRGAAQRRNQLLPDNSKHAPIPRRPAAPVLPQPLPEPGPSLARVLTHVARPAAWTALLSLPVRVQR